MASTLDDIKAWRRQDRLLSAIERPFKAKIIREKNRYITQASDYALKYRSLSDAQYIEHKQNVRLILDRYWHRTIRAFSLDVEKNTEAKGHVIKLEKKQRSLWENLFSAFITEYGAKKIVQISETTRNDIKDALDQAMSLEEGLSEINFVKEIIKVKGLSAFRADAIARTETHAAAMFSSVGTAKAISAEADVELMKKWIPALDERTRISHAAMVNHDPVKIDGFFKVGSERLKHPGDPSGSASNVINCRCVLVYV